MSRKSHLFRLALVAFLFLFTLTPTQTSPAKMDAGVKIEPELLALLAESASGEFIVRFSPQADLSPAYALGWDARGEYVYQALIKAAGVQDPARQLLDRLGVRYQTFIAGNELYVFNGTVEAAMSLAALPEVTSLRSPVTYQIETAKPAFGSYDVPVSPEELVWGVTYTKADLFWSTFGLQGDGILVANIDTGVQWDHPALDQAYKCSSDPGSSACWYDPENNCSGVPCDDNGHGTATMGPIVADDDPTLLYQAGMAPNAQWIACKACDLMGGCTEFAINACADWVLAPGGSPSDRPGIVNSSWGLANGGNNWFQARVAAWQASGIFPAFPAGASGPGCGTIHSPADYAEVFTSGAIDSTGTIAAFSGRGPSAYGITKPNVASPGVDIWTTYPTSGWLNYSGTAFSNSYSTGAVALLWSCAPALRGDFYGTIQAIQENTVYREDLSCGGEPGYVNNVYGFGNVDILAAGQAWCTGVDFLVTPTSLTAEVELGQSITQTLVISNGGDLLIDWEIYEAPYVDWLLASPIFGSIEGHTEQVISVNFDASQVAEPGDYHSTFTFYTFPEQGEITVPVTMTVGLTSTVVLTPDALTGSGYPGEIVTYTLSLTNTSILTDTYAITVTGVTTGWLVDHPAEVTLAAGEGAQFEVLVTVPYGTGMLPDTITVEVRSTSDIFNSDSALITTSVQYYATYLPAIIHSSSQ